MTLCEESLQGLGSFWSRYAGRVCQNVNIKQRESVAWKINTLKTGVTSFSSGLCSLTSQPISKGDWTVYFNEPTSSAESSYLVSINTDLLKYNSNKYSTFGVLFRFPSTGGAKRARGRDRHSEQASEQWHGGQHRGCQGDCLSVCPRF